MVQEDLQSDLFGSPDINDTEYSHVAYSRRRKKTKRHRRIVTSPHSKRKKIVKVIKMKTKKTKGKRPYPHWLKKYMFKKK